jgi:hypothetical protein
MSFWQRLFASRPPDDPHGAIEAEARTWIVQCPCGYEKSVWELGGIRAGAKSAGKRYLRKCHGCGRLKWHRVYKKSVSPNST